MRSVARICLTLALAVGLASSLMAADKAKRGQARKGKGKRQPTVIRFLPDEVKETLSDEQKEKIAKLDEEFGPKLAELNKKRQAILTPEQIKAQTDARKKAAEEGKKGKEAMEAVAAAVKLTDEQKKQMDELRKDSGGLQKIVHDKVLALLTPEQKAKVPSRGAGKGHARKAGAEGAKRKGGKGKKKAE